MVLASNCAAAAGPFSSTVFSRESNKSVVFNLVYQRVGDVKGFMLRLLVKMDCRSVVFVLFNFIGRSPLYCQLAKESPMDFEVVREYLALRQCDSRL